ncbi:glycosyltransferase family 2 protein [Neobacillus sp. FSL H8-0543]|uniref:glycosyltransferase family 2 protein n=1 Tax=Neobacillus sp. FSL H8-0543 TaxID=2954672 RepID=UPI0031599324
MDKVSVIMPVYNSASYLRRSIESVINQSYRNLELIIVDDCSTDNSLEIILQFADVDTRIKVYQNNNNIGPGETRNIGIKNSTGEFIQFIDADDCYDINMIEEMYNNIILTNSDVIICDYDKIIDDDQKRTYSISNLKNKNVKKHNKNNYDEMLIKLYDANLLFDVWNKIYRVDIIKNNNLFFPRLSLGEDALFNFSYFQCSNSISYIKKVLYNYYDIKTSLMNNYKEDQFVIQMEIYNSFKNTLVCTSQRSFIEKVGSDFLIEVVYGVINLSNRKCKYNNKEKYKKITAIINNATAKEIVKDGSNPSRSIKVFQVLIKARSKRILFLLIYFNFLRIIQKSSLFNKGVGKKLSSQI